MIQRGDVVWLVAEAPDISHPHVVIALDEATAIVAMVTSNLHRAKAPGNVLLEAGEGGLPKQSVIVAHALTVPLARLGVRVGALSAQRLAALETGLGFVESLRR
ncbi:MAG: type II toxin-antitoxin system PemK/MazF family toxin [Archangiaceae bacterium]|nr:type II toxin-antitoxin system PemK/MazF family toxin [Archangiaceae bacterium]